MDHTTFNLERTPCQPLPRKRSRDGASTEYGGGHLIAAHYSFIDPERMKGCIVAVRQVAQLLQRDHAKLASFSIIVQLI